MKITAHNLVKNYHNLTALNQVNLEVPAGKITALLGPNGAGKSSLIRILIGLTRADSGQVCVEWQGQKHRKMPAGSFAYLPEDRGLYSDQSVYKNLTYIGQLRGLGQQALKQQIDHWLDRLQLLERKHDKLSELSKGNQQKVQLASALLGEPDCLILDEPFSGLDPINQEQLMLLLQDYCRHGRTVLLSAHQMALIERLAEHMLILRQGQVLAYGSLHEVRQQLGERLVLEVHFKTPWSQSQWHALCAQYPDTQRLNAPAYGLRLPLTAQTDMNQLLQELMQLGPIDQIKQEVISLHELYLLAVNNPEPTRKEPAL